MSDLTRTDKIEKLAKLIGYDIIDCPLSDAVLDAEIARLTADRARIIPAPKQTPNRRHTGGHRTKAQNNFVYMD